MGWDKWWGNALDVGRNAVFAEYSHGINTLQPQTVFKLKLLRHWGYSPALLLDGTASLVEFCDKYAQDYQRTGQLPEIGSLIVSKDFRALDRDLATYTAGSFVNYLIGRKDLSAFQSLYQRASDLTFADIFAEVYGSELETVEAEWCEYLDTLNINLAAYAFFRDRAYALQHYEKALGLQAELVEKTGDTLQLGPELANLYYYFGNYDKAEEVYRAVAAHDSASTLANAYLANLLLIQGEVGEAENLYRETMVTDSNHYLPEWKLGQISDAEGDFTEAIEYFHSARTKTGSIPIRLDINLALGDAYRALANEDSARFYFQIALDTAKYLLGAASDRPLYHLRLGKAALRLGEAALALEHIKAEFFLEERMYYIGQILLAMGQAYDVLGERDEAVEQYQKLFVYPTGWLERRAAERYLEEPYFYR
jgi:tetratricopeptide (TPR) repeat protein